MSNTDKGRLINNIRSDINWYKHCLLDKRSTLKSLGKKYYLVHRGLWLLLIYRILFELNFQTKKNKGKLYLFLANQFHILVQRFVSIFMKSNIEADCIIGKNLFLSDEGGYFIGETKIGNGCTIQHSVTIGRDRGKNIPIIGDNTWVGFNVVIYGDISIGKGVVILPDTVIGKSIPDNCVVKGNPGRIIKRNIDNSKVLELKQYNNENLLDLVTLLESAD